MFTVDIQTNLDTNIHYTLTSLNDVSYSFVSGDSVELDDDWYRLSIHWQVENLNINDILINGCSIDYAIYTGYVEDRHEKLHQPATVLWEENTTFYIWIHSNLGVFFRTLYNDIDNGDFGKSLQEKYLLTVDKPLRLANSYPESVCKYFALACGPRWWNTTKADFPWKQLNFEIDSDLKNSLKNLEIQMRSVGINGQKCIQITKGDHQNWRQLNLAGSVNNSEPLDLDVIEDEFFRNLLEKIGFKKILVISILELDPKTYIPIHRDDHPSSKNLKYFQGAKKLYISYENSEDTYFKLGNAGLLPLNKPLMINTQQHSHSVVNNSDKIRKAIMLYGILEDDLIT